MRRVVVTGIGIVSCIGNNKTEVLDSLLSTKSGIVFSEEHKKYNFRSQVVGSIKNLDLDKHIDRKIKRFMGDGSAYSYIALKEAIKESGLEEKNPSSAPQPKRRKRGRRGGRRAHRRRPGRARGRRSGPRSPGRRRPRRTSRRRGAGPARGR